MKSAERHLGASWEAMCKPHREAYLSRRRSPRNQLVLGFPLWFSYGLGYPPLNISRKILAPIYDEKRELWLFYPHYPLVNIPKAIQRGIEIGDLPLVSFHSSVYVYQRDLSNCPSLATSVAVQPSKLFVLEALTRILSAKKMWDIFLKISEDIWWNIVDYRQVS